MKIEHQNRLNFNLKLVIQMGTFLIGVGILVWQSQSTFATFFSFRTTVAISTETSLSLPPPTIVLCQEHKWNNGMNDEYPVNMSDKDWVFKQFYQLNKEMNISIFDIDLTVGNNSLSIDGIWEGALGGPDIIFMVKEFLNPWKGLCYAIIPDPKTHMKLENYFYVKVRFSQEIKNPMVSAYLISSEDWHGFFLFQFGGLKPFKIPLTELKTVIGISIEQRKYFHVEDAFYLPLSLTNCMDYSSGEDSYMKCIVKSIVKNFENKTNATTGNLEAQVASKCPTPCRKMDYKGEIFDVPGSYLILKDNEILMEIYFKTMNTEIHNEILTFDLATFIGTAGGSLGLFLGFSLTGFAEQILNFLMKN